MDLQAEDRSVPLMAEWLRELSDAPDQMDPNSQQRFYDPTLLPLDLAIVEAQPDAEGITLLFSDGHRHYYPYQRLMIEASLQADPDDVPQPMPWTIDTLTPPTLQWDQRKDSWARHNVLEGFFKFGFALLRNTPSVEDSLLDIAQVFGPIRETNWGRLFNVRTEAVATDLAYTGLALTAHTDNPYRRSVPGIQFLHCLANNATGGESTIVDGLSICNALKAEAPDEYDILTKLPVSFRYLSSDVNDRETAPMIRLDHNGNLRQLRLSTRLDFPPAVAPEILKKFYTARRHLARLAAEPRFVFSFKLQEGDCLMMDNHRTLHGRTAFAEDGFRFLQGSYIDHDGPESQYRTLNRQLRKMQSAQTVAA
ncbi:MAG: TauD/TfdA family dioxygenase [Alphaproteobacteria bacterium]|nr:TauD/TfdA family dioxygenase [Alphaproteobacteria bacterium]